MKAIVAMDLNRVIGNKGKLPWYIPDDLKWFRKCTWNNIIVVGWNTFRDLPPLPNREIEVVDFGTGDIDSQPITNFNGVFGRISKLQKEFPPKPSHFDPLFGKEYWLVGGAKTYEFLIHCCSEIYVTHVLDEYEGDTYMIPFEDKFPNQEIIKESKQYWIVKYSR